MKNQFLSALAVILLLGLLTGCSGNAPATVGEITPTDSGSAAKESTKAPATVIPEATTSDMPGEKEMVVYYKDSTSQYLIRKLMLVADTSGVGMTDQLVDAGVLIDEVELLSMDLVESKKGVTVEVDYNYALADQLSTASEEEEWAIIGSIVNTFLHNMEADYVKLFVEGYPYESKRQSYDKKLKKYDRCYRTNSVDTIIVTGISKNVTLDNMYSDMGFSTFYAKNIFKYAESKNGKKVVFQSKQKTGSKPSVYMNVVLKDGAYATEKELMSTQYPDVQGTEAQFSLQKHNGILFSYREDGYAKEYYLFEAAGKCWNVELGYVDGVQGSLKPYLDSLVKNFRIIE